MIRRFGGPGMHGVGGVPLAALGGKGQGAVPFVGAYDAIASLVHVYEPARCTLSAYTGGNLLRLRRASDDAEADFSHVSAFDPELDLAAIAAWAGGASYIVTIYDQVGGNDITQATAGDQPLFVANIKNGHAGGRFDGANHYLSGAFTGALSQPYTVYALGALDAVAVNDGIPRAIVDSITTPARMLMYQYTFSNPDVWAIASVITSILSGGASDSAWNVWAALFRGANSQFWHNAVAESVVGNAGANNATGLTLGARYDGTTTYWDGDIVMCAIADPSHSDAVRGAMQTAINAYWAAY